LIQCILYSLAAAFYNAFLHPLAKVPGPKLYAVSSIPFFYQCLIGRWPFVLKELHDKYGSAVRVAPSDVSFITANAWKDIYGHKKGDERYFAKDARFYRGSLTSVPNILVADDQDHSRMRRLLAHAFSEKALRGQEDILKHYIGLFMTRMREQSASGDVVDMVKWFNFTTFDIIGDLAFGESFGCLESGGYHPWVAMIFDGFELATISQALKRNPRLAPLFSWMLPKALLRNKRDHFLLSFEKAKKRVETGRTDREDFTSYILRHNDERGMTADEIGENANVLIVAGSETTSTILSGTLFWLLKNRPVYRKLVDEIRSLFVNSEEITQITVTNAKYFLAVLNEGLRMYPPIPSGLPRITPAGGAIVDGYFMPENVSMPFNGRTL
jgi:cytochrome P450